MSDPVPPRPARIFGVCAAIAEDFGLNPDWLRMAFAGALLFALEGVLAAYAAAGAIVLASRLLFPNRPAAGRQVDMSTNEGNELVWRRAA